MSNAVRGAVRFAKQNPAKVASAASSVAAGYDLATNTQGRYDAFRKNHLQHPQLLVKAAFVGKTCADLGFGGPAVQCAAILNEVKAGISNSGVKAGAAAAAKGAIGMVTGVDTDLVASAASYLGPVAASMIRTGAHICSGEEEKKLKAGQQAATQEFKAQHEKITTDRNIQYQLDAMDRPDYEKVVNERARRAEAEYLEATRLEAARPNAQHLGAAKYTNGHAGLKHFVHHESQKGSDLDSICPDPMIQQTRERLNAADAHVQSRPAAP